jgi:hypothetical protein
VRRAFHLGPSKVAICPELVAVATPPSGARHAAITAHGALNAQLSATVALRD